MPDDRILENERSAYFDFLQELLLVIEQRPFERQVRSEECGCCTNSIAEQILQSVSDNKELSFLVLIRLLERIGKFVQVPHFTYRILESALVLMREQSAKHPYWANNSSHDHLCAAIRKFVKLAQEAYSKHQYLLFCRIAEPIIRISPGYEALCESAKIPLTQQATSCINEIKERTMELAVNQQKVENWVKVGRKKFPSLKKQRGTKQVWAGGECHILKSSGEPAQRFPEMKVVNYDESGMMVYSRQLLENNRVYDCMVTFNCIDLPFVTQIAVDKRKLRIGVYQLECMKMCRVEHCYHLIYMNSADKPTPKPNYYYLSMCRSLFEQRTVWEPEAFVETFCNSYWAPAALVRE